MIASVYKTPRLRTSTNYYYVNMAASDFLSSLATWPLYLTDRIITSRGSLIQGLLASVGCKLGVFVRLVSFCVSIHSLVLIAVDRFIAILFPLKASLLTGKVRVGLLFVTWAISILYCAPTPFYFKVEEVGQETSCRFEQKASASMQIMILNITIIIMTNVAPLVAIVILYSRILHVLKRRPNQEHGTRSNYSEEKRRKQNQNIMKIFKSIVVAYFVCYLLFCVYLILKITVDEPFIKDKCGWILGFAYFVFPTLSTAVNPVILFLFSSNFRVVLQTLFPFTLAKCSPCCKARRNGIIASNHENVYLPELVKYRQTYC